MNDEIIWEPKFVKIKDLIANPQNPKIVNEVGKRRLQKSLDKYGLAGTLVANLDLQIIDGHSRVKEAIEKGTESIWVSLPSRLLTEEEYKTFNAMYDASKAGDVDEFIIENVFSDEVLEEWEMKKGKKSKAEKDLFPIVAKFDEKHDALIIIMRTETESSFIRNALLLDEMSSYKNKNVGQSFVCTGEQFIKIWKAK